MTGLTSLKTRARRLSAPLLFAYCCALLLMAFGHQCVRPLPASASAAAASHGKQVARAPLAAPASEHICAACALERSTASVLLTEAPPGLSFVLNERCPAFLSAAPRRGNLGLRASRGPPSC